MAPSKAFLWLVNEMWLRRPSCGWFLFLFVVSYMIGLDTWLMISFILWLLIVIMQFFCLTFDNMMFMFLFSLLLWVVVTPHNHIIIFYGGGGKIPPLHYWRRRPQQRLIWKKIWKSPSLCRYNELVWRIVLGIEDSCPLCGCEAKA